MTTPPTLTNWLSIFLLGLVWGGTFMVVALALEGYGPVTVACARTSLGALALSVLVIVLRRPMPPRGVWPHLLLIGATNTALPFVLLSWGQQYVPSAFAGAAMAVLPLLILPMAHVFTDDRMTRRRAAGVAIGFAGTALLVGPGVLHPEAGMAAWGQLACLAAVLSYAVSSLMTRRCPPVDPVTMAAAILLVGAAILVPAMLLTEGLPHWAGTRPGLAIIVLGLLPTAMAALIRVAVIRSAGPVFMTLVNYQVPLWSLAFGHLVLGEALPPVFFLALGLILSGLVVSQLGSLQRLFSDLVRR